MAPRKIDNPTEPRRSSRIADKPKSPVGGKPVPKARAKKVSKKREVEEDGEHNEKPLAKKAKGSSEENGEEIEEEHDQLPDDDDDELDEPNLNVGDLIPSVTLKNEKDEDVNVAELTAEKGLVLFLVPKADTPGCTKQACGFRDSYADFTKHDFSVYCVSADTTTAQAKWQTKQELPYSLLSDRQRVLIRALGAADGNKTLRSHFVFEKGGKLVNKKILVKPVDSPQQALAFVASMQA